MKHERYPRKGLVMRKRKHVRNGKQVLYLTKGLGRNLGLLSGNGYPILLSHQNRTRVQLLFTNNWLEGTFSLLHQVTPADGPRHAYLFVHVWCTWNHTPLIANWRESVPNKNMRKSFHHSRSTASPNASTVNHLVSLDWTSLGNPYPYPRQTIRYLLTSRSGRLSSTIIVQGKWIFCRVPARICWEGAPDFYWRKIYTWRITKETERVIDYADEKKTDYITVPQH